MGIGCFGWFVTLAFCVILAASLSPWVREKTVTTLLILVTTGFYAVVVFLFWPTRASVYFTVSVPDVASMDKTIASDFGSLEYQNL